MTPNAHDDFAAMLETGTSSSYRKGFDPGEKVSAYVISTKGNYVILDIKAKNEGIIPIAEVTQEDGTLSVKAGETISTTFVGVQHGSFIFTTKDKVVGVTDRTLRDAFESQMPIDGVVQSERTGGYEVIVAAHSAFCPYSQINLFRQEGAEYVGKKFTFLITEYGEDDRGLNVIVSRRAILEIERAKQREELFKTLEEGQTRKGVVTRIVDFGIFVDLGGAEGLVPLRELSWQRNAKPEDLCKPGDDIEVMVNTIDEEAGRISLSIRNLITNPWDTFVEDYPVGAVLMAKIVRIERFGAFAELIPGVDGLLTNGRLAQGKRITSPREVVSEGQEVEVQIDTIDTVKRQVALKLVDRRFESLGKGGLNTGEEVDGIVESIQPFGVFVRLSEEKTGLLHISETGLPKGTAPLAQLERAYEIGKTIRVVIKSMEGSRISLASPTKWAAEKAIEAEGDPMDWVKTNNATNDGQNASNNAFANALDKLFF